MLIYGINTTQEMKAAGLQGGHQPLPDFCELDFPQAQKIVNR